MPHVIDPGGYSTLQQPFCQTLYLNVHSQLRDTCKFYLFSDKTYTSTLQSPYHEGTDINTAYLHQYTP